MRINASQKKRAHWQSTSIRGKRTWKRDSNSRHLPAGAGLVLVAVLLSRGKDTGGGGAGAEVREEAPGGEPVGGKERDVAAALRGG